MPRRRFALPALSLLLLLAGCHGQHSTASDGAWAEHKDPHGFDVSYPQGWDVDTASDGRILIHSADKTVFVVVQPFISRKSGLTDGSQNWINQALDQMYALFAHRQIKETKQISMQPDEVAATISYSYGGMEAPPDQPDLDTGKPGQANVLCSISGGSGMFYAIAAPSEVFADQKPALMKIVRSFHFTQPTASAVKQVKLDPGIKYTTWKDPKDGAFTCQVPAGWSVTGGLSRHGAADMRAQVDAVSPDNLVHVWQGDSTLPPYALPNPLLDQSGYREGMTYNPGGTEMMISHYQTGLGFSKSYVQQWSDKQQKENQAVADLDISCSRDRSDIADILNRQYQQAGLSGIVSISFGESVFTYKQGNRSMRGCCMASTELTSNKGTGVWIAFPFGYTAPEDQADLAEAIMSHMILRPDPQWAAKQGDVARKVYQIAAKSAPEITNVIQSSYEKQLLAQDDFARKWSNTILGLTDVRNHDTGDEWKVASGHNYYWQKGDAASSPNAEKRPEIDLTPLEAD